MSETVPARVVAPELDEFARLGQWLAASEVSEPNESQRGAAAALRIYFARELGLSPLAASELSVIRGRLVVSAKLLRARAALQGYRVVRASGDETTCTAHLLERATGELIGEATFTIELARKRGLIRPKSNWETMPDRMLWARASKNVVDDFAPEVSLGLVLEDEAVEITGEVTGESWEDATVEKPPEVSDSGVISGGHGASYAPDPPGPVDEEQESEFAAPSGPRGGGNES